MTILVTGSNGMLGSELTRQMRLKKIAHSEADRHTMDITSSESVDSFLKDGGFTTLVNCAAYTNVNEAEVFENQKEVLMVNAGALKNLSEACLKYHIHLIHISTDFVFDGDTEIPYTEYDDCNPLNYYGFSKLLGENIIREAFSKYPNFSIFRVQWLYGNDSKTFFNKIKHVANQGKDLSIYDDELGSPCSVSFVSDTLLRYIDLRESRPELLRGTFHLTHNNSCSRYDCGKFFLDTLSYKVIVAPSGGAGKGVLRPMFGVMDNSNLSHCLGINLGTWEDDLLAYIEDWKEGESNAS